MDKKYKITIRWKDYARFHHPFSNVDLVWIQRLLTKAEINFEIIENCIVVISDPKNWDILKIETKNLEKFEPRKKFRNKQKVVLFFNYSPYPENKNELGNDIPTSAVYHILSKAFGVSNFSFVRSNQFVVPGDIFDSLLQ